MEKSTMAAKPSFVLLVSFLFPSPSRTRSNWISLLLRGIISSLRWTKQEQEEGRGKAKMGKWINKERKTLLTVRHGFPSLAAPKQADSMFGWRGRERYKCQPRPKRPFCVSRHVSRFRPSRLNFFVFSFRARFTSLPSPHFGVQMCCLMHSPAIKLPTSSSSPLTDSRFALFFSWSYSLLFKDSDKWSS